MKTISFIAALLLSATCTAADMSKSCSIVDCNPGDKAVTFIESKNEFYFACPTLDIAEYVTTTIGMVEATYQITGKLPNISTKTGEPEFEGQTKEMLDMLRSKAEVSTYDEAQAQCQKGKSKISVTVMNNPEDTMSIWVSGSDNKPFWMPKAFLNKR
ncbi:hypothetical protein HK44_020690 [Pseudomonas fluorescens HK44]|uniref:Uncharacterized protein n=1 Tax=Pseudomonas fluorescens HK44 TaxID=1042209 RepID=A0A010S770_PSEFL|nr:hypothetical protein [Pseudomonas fluorescens]EXF96289.1 hypothetical protein HK44_020690 [Pseudomonas fluorescens HK44]